MELNVEIFATGLWNKIYDIKDEDLKGIVIAFEALKKVHDVPLKMGHNKKQPFIDGQPSLGWVEKVWVEGNKLLAKFVDIPQVVFNAMQKKLYKHVSVELDIDVEHKGSDYDYVLSGVALLGADIPAVNTLKDLKAYMGSGLSFKKRVVFTTSTETKKHIEVNMDIKEELEALKIKFAATEAEHQKSVTENVQLKTQITKDKAEFSTLKEVEASRKVGEQRILVETKLEVMVKEKKIAPFTRDDYLKQYDDAAIDDKKHVITSIESLEKTINGNPKYFGAEQARKIEEKKRSEEGKDASEVVTERTREYMAKNGEKSFSVAKTAILRADLELANSYIKMEDAA